MRITANRCENAAPAIFAVKTVAISGVKRENGGSSQGQL
jgi:hypothetical protein